MEFSSAIYRGDPYPEFSFSFKFQASGLFIVCRIDDIARLQKSIYEKFTIHSTAMCNNLISTYQLSHYARDGNSSHHL